MIGGRRLFFFGKENAPEAAALWQWSNYLHAVAAAAGRGVLHVNLDETHVCLRPTPRPGNAVIASKRCKRKRAPTGNATKADQRSGFTHVALICDDTAVQPQLPQVLICGESLLPKRQHAALAESLPANVFLLRTKKGWNSSAILVKHIQVLARVARRAAPGRQVLLSMDVARLHLPEPVVRACHREGIFYHLVPAQMTWLLQPCDTRVFALYKRALMELTEQTAMSSEDGRVDIDATLRNVAQVIRQVMQGKAWQHAFGEVGLSGDQASLSSAVNAALELRCAPPEIATQPSDAALASIYPRRARVPRACLFEPHRRGEHSGLPPLPPPAMPPVSEPPDGDAVSASPWLGRTRSTSTCSLEAVVPPAPASHPGAASSSASGPCLLAASAWPAAAPKALPAQWPPRGTRLPRAPLQRAPSQSPPPPAS